MISDSQEIVRSELATLHDYPCRKIRVDKGEFQIEQWLATEMSGFPLRVAFFSRNGTLIKLIDVTEFERLDLDGLPYAFPVRIVTQTGPNGNQLEVVTLVDRESLQVNQVVDPSLFQQYDVPVRFILNVETGHRTDTRTWKVYDREFRIVRSHDQEPKKSSVTAVATPKPVTTPSVPATVPPATVPNVAAPATDRHSLIMALILTQLAVALVLYAIYRWRK